MATKRMLVDATHPEETRIVVTSGNRLEEFDFESATRRQLRGNIYLAKVTRVEPSLQAAFVDYGGNRHGFLAFSEIHPDYYQIPVSDREALLAAEAEQAAARAESEDTQSEAEAEDAADLPENGAGDAAETGNGDENGDGSEAGADTVEQAADDESVDDVGGDDALEEAQERKHVQVRKYKIQEVIKRRQVMLVQVVKEERGNKGAALTTYLSLAGRYSVLMPNTARGGGISRKITNSGDRKKLKEIAGELEVPQGMGVILRTAGASRTKAEVKRDFEYLLRLWENVRNLTLQSTAPCLVYEEGSLIKRTIRDLYNKDIEEVLVSGDAAYREAKDFMRMIMPSHAKNVKQYKEDQPIFSKYNIETQLDSMFSPQVTLPSGGYIVINPTEALVSIDVNSGRATKEHNIEDTALQTNLEAADEVARQLRLRDLAGLIVIDFIDMMEKRSNRQVERRLKDALKSDRARIQVGRISHFGLMEMSRQRMRFGVLESSTHVCPVCNGAGIVRSVESVAVMVMRAIEEHVLRKPGQSINVRVPSEVALYILNAKRDSLAELEAKCGLTITISADEKLVGSAYHIEKGESRAGAGQAAVAAHIQVDSAEIGEIEEEAEEERAARRPRRRRRGGRDRQREEAAAAETEAEAEGEGEEAAPPAEAEAAEEEEAPRKRRRRGRRGGRRNRRAGAPQEESETAGDSEALDAVEGTHHEAMPAEIGVAHEDLDVVPMADEEAVVPAEAEEQAGPETAEEKPAKKPRRTRRKKTEPAAEAEASVETVAEAPAAPEEPAPDESAQAGRPRKELPPEGVVVTSSSAKEGEEDEDKPKKSGWWQRGFFG